jgi:hypothetical protein
MSRSDDHHLNGADVKGGDGGASAASLQSNGKSQGSPGQSPLRALLRYGGACTSIAGLLVIVGVWYLVRSVEHSPWDEGPFRGTAVKLPHGKPGSRVECEKMVFECYDPFGRQPVVVSRRSDGWGIGAWEVTASRGERVQTCQLYRVRHRGGAYVVDGSVVWTYGQEHATFYFDTDGRLMKFYLSW